MESLIVRFSRQILLWLLLFALDPTRVFPKFAASVQPPPPSPSSPSPSTSSSTVTPPVPSAVKLDPNIQLPLPELAPLVPLKFLSNLHVPDVSQCSDLKQPPMLYSYYGQLNVDLTVDVVRVVTELFSYNTRAYCYNEVCTVPGPTLYVEPGDVIT